MHTATSRFFTDRPSNHPDSLAARVLGGLVGGGVCSHAVCRVPQAGEERCVRLRRDPHEIGMLRIEFWSEFLGFLCSVSVDGGEGLPDQGFQTVRRRPEVFGSRPEADVINLLIIGRTWGDGHTNRLAIRTGLATGGR